MINKIIKFLKGFFSFNENYEENERKLIPDKRLLVLYQKAAIEKLKNRNIIYLLNYKYLIYEDDIIILRESTSNSYDDVYREKILSSFELLELLEKELQSGYIQKHNNIHPDTKELKTNIIENANKILDSEIYIDNKVQAEINNLHKNI